MESGEKREKEKIYIWTSSYENVTYHTKFKSVFNILHAG